MGKEHLKLHSVTIRAVVLALACIIVLSSCAPIRSKGELVDFSAMSAEELGKYASIGQYKGLQIALEGRSRGEAVRAAICESTEVYDYPTEQVYYYMDQLRSEYKYLAEKGGMSYDDLLEELGVDEGDILAEAKELTRNDLAYSIIQRNEGISLSESEKTEHFARYAEKYAADYGYDAAYVEENMSELIYDSMLYDKTTEFLILNNTFN